MPSAVRAAFRQAGCRPAVLRLAVITATSARFSVPQAVAMKITGHRTDSMFRRYAIVNEEQKREALAKTQQHLAASAGRKVVSMGQKQ